MNGKLVLVTGGGGFIGSHLAEGLIAAGARVRVLDNFSSGHKENLDGLDIELIEGDIRDTDACAKACAGAFRVFHQAALGSVPLSLEDPAKTFAVNVGGTANVFAAARDAEVERVVYASSSAVYGDSAGSPKREAEIGNPLSPYAASKTMAEALADVYARCYGMQFVGLRYFNIYGARQDPSGPYAAVIPKFFAACSAGEPPTIFGDGTQTRDFTHVSDVVRANMLAATTRSEGAIALNIGAGITTTVTQLAEAIITVTGSDFEPKYVAARSGDILHSCADASLAAAAIGWRAEVSLAAGLAQTKP